MTGAATTTNYVGVGVATNVTISGVNQSAYDYGNSTYSPGVKMNIPLPLCASLALNPSSTEEVFNISGIPAGTNNNSQTFVCDVSCMIRQ